MPPSWRLSTGTEVVLVESFGRRPAAIAGAILAAILLLAPAPRTEAAEARVLEGDMLELDGIRYCLYGIDAPDPGQTCAAANGRIFDCGKIARTALMDLVAGARIRCTPTGEIRPRCRVARCTADGFDLSANMVHTGWALAAPGYESDFKRQQTRARKRRHGLWRGTFEPPWEWRQRGAERRSR